MFNTTQSVLDKLFGEDFLQCVSETNFHILIPKITPIEQQIPQKTTILVTKIKSISHIIVMKQLSPHGFCLYIDYIHKQISISMIPIESCLNNGIYRFNQRRKMIIIRCEALSYFVCQKHLEAINIIN